MSPKLSDGWCVEAAGDGEFFVIDEHGHPRHERELSPAQRREAGLAFHQVYEDRVADRVAGHQSDPEFAARREWIARNATPEQMDLVNRDPQAFNRAMEIARQNLGPTEAETNAWIARDDRREELEGVLAKGEASTNDLAELFDIHKALKAEGGGE
jgi:hypothetical protein